MNLRFHRQRRGLSIKRLARLAGVDQATISRLENNTRPAKRREAFGASYRTIVRLARALDMQPEELAPVELSAMRTPPDGAPPLANTGGDEP